MRAIALAIALAFVAGEACGGKAATRTTATTKKKKQRRERISPTPGSTQVGLSAWYGGRHHGGPTASGERFNKHKMTAAHLTLPFGTRVRVTHRKTGKSVIVRINDRGPYGRAIIDISEAAAKQLGIIREGVAPVTVEVLGQ